MMTPHGMAQSSSPGLASSRLEDTPRSMLGFMYRGTYFPSFRRAAWDDLHQLFRWFKADGNAAFVEACTKVDHAAYLLRRYTDDVDAREPNNHEVYAQAIKQMAEYAPIQFREALAQVCEQYAAGTLEQFESEPNLPNDTTLALTYALIHHPAYRTEFIAGRREEAERIDPQVRVLLERLGRCITERKAPEELRACLNEVQDALAEEYEVVAWKICW